MLLLLIKEDEMISKRIFLSILFAIVAISFLFMVSAATTINPTLPAVNSTNISGSYTLNATILGGGAAGNTTGNVTFYYKPWSYAANATWISIATTNNVTASQPYFNATWATTALDDGKNYTLNFTAYDYSGGTVNATNVSANMTIDNTPPLTTAYSGATLTAYANGTSIKTNTTLTGALWPNNITLNISVTDATVGLLNTSNLFCFINIAGEYNHSVPLLAGRWCNSSDINVTGLTDGNKTVNIYINDTLNNMRLNNTLVVQIDATAPTATATCSPATAQTGDAFPCSCAGTDATSGVSTSTGTSTSPDGIAKPSSTGGFTYTCTVTDNGGLTASASKTYTVTQNPGSGSGGGGSGTTTPKPQVNSFTKVTPGAATISKYFDPDLGLKQIEIEVNNEAQNVKITVTKYDGKPAAVSVSKSGKVYQYMQINVSNVAGKLSKAKVTAKVEKLWVTSNGVDKNNVVISKFDETNGKWNELPTTYSSEDTTYYYYDAEVTSFSYFAISEKAAPGTGTDSGTGSGTTGTTETTETGKSLTWLWIVIAVLVIALVWFFMRKKR